VGKIARAAAESASAELQDLQLRHAKTQARRYLSFAKKSHGGDAARYTMEEYLRLQGVRADLIVKVVEPLKVKFKSLRESHATD
jgi:hypothetical protein